ncbi:MAG: bifunctional metallophosphatase/5'-nucleotidase [Erysipelotrichaceae bacterium]|nr:bifunctional metallophosphatase/5'-nucleotidase [Erysipelotrichaceae bacterium]
MQRLDLLAHADFHGQFRADEDNPGLSRFYSAIGNVRSLNPEGTMLLDAGDESKCLWHGKAVYDGLDLIGTDAMVLGNHEFDAGREEMERCIRWGDAHFPMLCANVIYKENRERIKGVQPYAIIEKAGIRIGILGLTSSYTPYIVEKSAFEDFEMLDSVSTIRKYVPEMRKEGAELIVLLSHFPFYPDKTGELFDVYEQVEDLSIDVFIGGHIPGDFAEVLDGCAIVKGGFHGTSLGHVTIGFDTETRKKISADAEIIDVKQNASSEAPEIENYVREVTKDYEYYFTEVLAEAMEDIPMHLSCESPMGDLLSDAIREASDTDFAYFNCTSCGRRIAKGPLTRYSIQKAMAFNEKIQVTVMKGSDLYDLFELIHEPEIFGNNAELMFSGLKVRIDHSRPAGRKVVWIKDLEDHEIDKERIFTVCTSKYMSNGGNETDSFTERFVWKELDTTMHDAIAAYIQRKGAIRNEMDHRYEFIGHPENDNSPW